MGKEVGTWESVSIGIPTSGNLVNGSIALKNEKLGLGYISIQINGTSTGSSITFGMRKKGTVEMPIYGYNSFSGRQVYCVIIGDTLKITGTEPVVRVGALFLIEK